MNLNLYYKYGGNRHALHKFLLVMKLIVILITTAILQVSASTYAQKITLNKTNMPLEKVMKEIRQQSGYDFFYDLKLIKNTKPVSINVKDASLEEVLDKCFANQPLTYKIGDKVVMIKEKEPSFPDKVRAYFVNITVNGRVLNEKGEALPGATVKIKGTDNVVRTNENGNFTMSDVDENSVIVISYLGYVTKEIKASSDLSAIRLELNMAKLEEVKINAGYYSVTDRERTGSIGQIKAKDISNQPISNPLQALQGRISGVVVTPQTGVPGGGMSVRIRGKNSIRSTGNDPFYIVDGVPYLSNSVSSSSTSGQILGGLGNNPLNFINASDIQSIEVLKDADATAIYGSRGANGVILITTKNGVIGATKLDVNYYKGLGSVNSKMKLLNTEQYLEMRNEAFKNDGAKPSTSDFDLLQYDKNRYTNWQKELLGGHSDITNVQASVSGGNQQTQFQLSGGYYKEGTVFPGDFSYDKKSAHASLVHSSPNKKLNLSFTANYVTDDSSLPQNDLTGTAITLPPNAPSLYNAEGGLNWSYNWQNGLPLLYLKREYFGTTNNLIANMVGSYEIIKDLKLKIAFGYNLLLKKENSTYPITSYHPASNVTTGSAFFADNEISSWITEPQIEYKRTIGKGTLEILTGITFQERTNDGKTLFAEGFKNDYLLGNIAAASSNRISEANYINYRYNALFGRINYNLENRYIINLTARRDGSSRFGDNKQFSNFGAIGAAWIITNTFPIRFLNFAKVRGSYGITGNDQIPDYGYLSTYSSTTYPYFGNAGLIPSRIANPDYSWEKTKKIEAALEIAALDSRLSATLGLYLNKSSNQLVGYSLPDITGFTSIQYNLPATVQNSGLEFDASYIVFKTKNFRWETSINLTVPKNILLSYPNIAGSSYANLYVIGQPLSIQNKYHYIGIDKKTGTYMLEDVNGDGIYSSPADLLPLKSIKQDYYGGINQSFSYKRVKFDIFLQFVKQTGSFYFSNAPGMFGNQPIEVMNRWQQPSDNTIYQMFTQNFGGTANQIYQKAYINGDAGITDASFIRIKNISLSWSPSFLYSKKMSFLEGSNIFLKGQNLFTITNYKGLDPETQSLQNLPPLSVIALGIQVNLK